MNVEVKKIQTNFHSLKVGDVYIDRTGDIFIKVEALHDNFNSVNLRTGLLMLMSLDSNVENITNKVKVVGIL